MILDLCRRNKSLWHCAKMCISIFVYLFFYIHFCLIYIYIYDLIYTYDVSNFYIFSLSLKYTLLLHVVTMKVILSYFMIHRLIDSNNIINIILVRFNNTLINIVMVTVIKNFVWIESIIPTGTSTIWCAWNFQLMATTTRWTFQKLCSVTPLRSTQFTFCQDVQPKPGERGRDKCCAVSAGTADANFG